MILNQITNHVREIILGLRTEFVEVPDYITHILDGFARYKMGGAAGLGISIPTLLNRGRAVFYSGLDTAQEVQDDTKVERHFAYWKHMYADVVMPGTDLKLMTGMTVADLVRQDMTLGHMNASDQLQLLNLFESKYMTSAAALQGKKVTATHGHYQSLPDDETGREPESLDDLFNEEANFHGVAIDDLGSWDNDHVWGRRPISNIGTTAQQKLRNRPIIYDFNNATVSWTTLHPVLRRLQQVVKSPKLAYMWDDGFSTLVQEIRNQNDSVPMLIVGGAGWEFDMDCVKIAGTTIIPDPNAKEGTIRVLNVGNQGLENGTVFPFYYDPMTEPIDAFKMKADMLSDSKGRPKGMEFGSVRPTPYTGSEWDRNSTYADAASSRIFLDYIPVLSTIRGFQLEGRGLAA